MRKYIQQLMLLGSLLLACGQLHAQATLSVQGTIQRSTGAAVDDGDYDITFRLYTAPTGGSPVWSETQSGVEIIGGVYSVALGSVNPLNAPFDQTYYLGISVGTGAEHTPRTLLTSAPYALSLLGQDNKFPSTGMVKMESLASGQATTTATSYAVTADDHVIFLDHTANQNVTLPAASAANAGRHLVLVNKEAVAKTLTSSNYVNLAGATSTDVPATGVVELQSDGSVWRQTGGYVQPAATVAKAYVRCRRTSYALPASANTLTLVPYTELSDAQNCWDATTHTFTAPRTGVYRISGNVTAWVNGANNHCITITDQFSEAIALMNNPNFTELQTLVFATDYPMTAGQTFQVKYYTSPLATEIQSSGSWGSNSGYLTISEL